MSLSNPYPRTTRLTYHKDIHYYQHPLHHDHLFKQFGGNQRNESYFRFQYLIAISFIKNHLRNQHILNPPLCSSNNNKWVKAYKTRKGIKDNIKAD